jgi:hypothetical protein
MSATVHAVVVVIPDSMKSAGNLPHVRDQTTVNPALSCSHAHAQVPPAEPFIKHFLFLVVPNCKGSKAPPVRVRVPDKTLAFKAIAHAHGQLAPEFAHIPITCPEECTMNKPENAGRTVGVSPHSPAFTASGACEYKACTRYGALGRAALACLRGFSAFAALAALGVGLNAFYLPRGAAPLTAPGRCE